MGLTKKQHEVFQFIKSYTLKKGYAPTQREIKDHFQLKSYGSVQKYLKYLKEAGLLANDWNSKRGLTLLESEGNTQKREPKTPQKLNPVITELEIPLLGDVAAGNPIEALENPTEHISVPLNLLKKGGQHFALRVQGESMIEDGILDGDLAIIQAQSTASTGQTIVAVIDGEATLKKFYKKKEIVELHPANHTMKPILVNSQHDLKIVGKLVGLLRVYS
ncbi:MAG: transcriptional repressor LexA [Bacteriovoracaceae bacterium]|nr:transcriptional repressor LexA [Bacteriovoracaceae bacterium]